MFQQNQQHEDVELFFRYYLQPRENGGKSVKVEELGSLRLNIVYTEDHVFPSEHYTPLRDLLLYSANVQVCVSGPFFAPTYCIGISS